MGNKGPVEESKVVDMMMTLTHDAISDKGERIPKGSQVRYIDLAVGGMVQVLYEKDFHLINPNACRELQ